MRGAAVAEQPPEAKRFQEVVELHEFGVALYRQRMRRENPQAGENEIDAMVRAWLAERPRDIRLHRPSKERDHGSR